MLRGLFIIFTKKNICSFLLAFSATAIFSQNNAKLFLNRAEKFNITNSDSALYYYKKTLSILPDNLTNDTVTSCYCNIARLEIEKDLQNAFKNALLCLKSAEIRKDTAKIISAYTNLGIILSHQRKFAEAIIFEKKAILFSYLTSSHLGSIHALSNLSDMLASINKHDSSIKVLMEAKAIAKKYAYIEEIPNILANLGNTYYAKAETTQDKTYYKLAASFAQQAIDGVNNLPDSLRLNDEYRKDIAYAYGLNGASLAALGNYTESEAAYEKAISFFREKNEIFYLNFLYYELTHVYINARKNERALIYLSHYDSSSKLLFNTENSKSLSEMQTKYETDKKETENKLLQTENQLSGKTIKQQKLINYFIIGGLILALLLAYFIFRGLKNQRKANTIISKQKHEVEKQKEIVDEKQKEILDSIRYAKRIQNSLLTSEKYIARHLARYQELKPRD